MRHNNRRMAARARVYTVPYQRLLYDPQSGERENIVSSAPRLGTRCKCDYTVMNPRAGIALMRPLRLAVSSITGVYARFHDSRINSHAEPGSLARFLDTDDNLPIKTLEFRDSEKIVLEAFSGSLFTKRSIRDNLPRKSESSSAGGRFRHKVPPTTQLTAPGISTGRGQIA